jgi:hypothetical protein
MSQRPVIVFDVNETLLNLETIRPTFDRIFRFVLLVAAALLGQLLLEATTLRTGAATIGEPLSHTARPAQQRA